MKYKIIIPQEEPKQEQQKQHLINMMHDDDELGLYEEPKQEILPEFSLSKDIFDKISDLPKQETLEEAAENYGWRIKKNTFSDRVKANELADSAKQDFIEGANYQAERMYSEEEVISILYSFHKEENSRVVFSLSGITKWFKQFKKK